LAARGHILPLGGSSAAIIIIMVFYPSGPARTLTLYTIFAIPPPSSGWIIAEKGSQQHACLPPVACSRERMSDDWHLVEGFTVAGHRSNLMSEAQGRSVYSLLSDEGKKGQEILLDAESRKALPDDFAR
jgi:hypothetical protein